VKFCSKREKPGTHRTGWGSAIGTIQRVLVRVGRGGKTKPPTGRIERRVCHFGHRRGGRGCSRGGPETRVNGVIGKKGGPHKNGGNEGKGLWGPNAHSKRTLGKKGVGQGGIGKKGSKGQRRSGNI